MSASLSPSDPLLREEPTPSSPPSNNNNHSDEETHSNSSTSASSPLILYRPPTIVSLLRTAAINLVLPFINGLMLGFGELFAHEIAFRLGWSGTRIFPAFRRTAGPGIEIRETAFPESDRRRRERDLRNMTSLE